MILALDLGTVTGYAVSTPAGIVSGTVNLRPRGSRFEGGGMRYLRFRDWLAERGLASSDVVYFEEVRRHMSTDAAHVYGGLQATLTAYCEDVGASYSGVPVQTIKRHATGRGNASKQDVIDAMNAKGFKVTSDDEADALALLDYAMNGAKHEN